MATSASPAPLRSTSATELEMTSNHLGIGGLRDGNAVILHINGRNSFSSVESSQEEYQSVQAELRKLKDRISQLSKENFKLEKDLKFLDSKIALLINHKISLEEVESHLEDAPHLPTSLKTSHHHGVYGELFLVLQTQPEYIAKLTRLVSQKGIDGLLQIVMFSLYGNQYEDREEHLLLSMFEYALTYEVQEATEINSLMRANTAITRMMTTYCRRGPGQEYIRLVLGDIIERLSIYNQPLEIDPLKIYQGMIDDNEIRRPDESSVLLDEAESNPLVQKRIKERVLILEEFVLEILDSLKTSIEKVPYGIRWLCKATKVLVQEKFPEASSERINSFIGGFFFLRYINPVIATPHAYRLLSNTLSSQTKRNFTLVAKVIQKLANTSSVRASNMLPLEPFVRAHNEELKAFLSDLCEVPDFHEQLQLEEYMAVSRKEISIEISLSEICTLQSLLLNFKDDIASGPNDKVCSTLDKMPPPSEEMEKSKQPFRLKLCQRLSDPGVPSCSPMLNSGIGMNVADQLASARRKCKHLLIQLFKMAPSCMVEADLNNAIKVALSSPIEEIVTHAEVISEQLKAIKDLGSLSNGGKDLFDEIRAILPDRSVLLQRSQTELDSLQVVLETIAEHAEFLQEQSEAYRVYLDAVRAKVGQAQQHPTFFRKSRGTYKFSHSQLERDGIIVETPGIPMQRRGNIYYSISCQEPGIYNIVVHQKGSEKVIYEKQLHLEDLLEHQHFPDPIIDMEGLVLLNARQTLLLLSRYFIKKDPPRPVSRHLSAPTIPLHAKS